MNKNLLFNSSLCGILSLVFTACNIFNPTESASGISSQAEAATVEAYKNFRDNDYREALEYFDKAIKKDSSFSEAYLGAAKSILAIHKINVFSLIGEIKKAQSETIPFLTLDGDTLENYIAGISEALPYIRELIRRDTLTTEKNKLSDKNITFSQIGAGYAILETGEILLNFRKKTKGFNLNIKKNAETDKIEINLTDLYEASLQDTATISEFNNALAELQQNTTKISGEVLSSVTKVIDLSSFIDDSSTSTSASITEDIDKTINDLGNQILFYSVADRTDNDGDGCVDEEILDGKDNDGDGLIDEDLRIVALSRRSDDVNSSDYHIVFNIAPDFLDNDKNGIMDDSLETVYAVPDSLRLEKNNFDLLFAANKDFKNTDDAKLKLKVMQDTDFKNVKYDLEWRKKNIGGCWVNYDENDFEAWFQGRN